MSSKIALGIGLLCLLLVGVFVFLRTEKEDSQAKDGLDSAPEEKAVRRTRDEIKASMARRLEAAKHKSSELRAQMEGRKGPARASSYVSGSGKASFEASNQLDEKIDPELRDEALSAKEQEALSSRLAKNEALRFARVEGVDCTKKICRATLGFENAKELESFLDGLPEEGLMPDRYAFQLNHSKSKNVRPEEMGKGTVKMETRLYYSMNGKPLPVDLKLQAQPGEEQK